jgi:hypothetical protein
METAENSVINHKSRKKRLQGLQQKALAEGATISFCPVGIDVTSGFDQWR